MGKKKKKFTMCGDMKILITAGLSYIVHSGFNCYKLNQEEGKTRKAV